MALCGDNDGYAITVDLLVPAKPEERLAREKSRLSTIVTLSAITYSATALVDIYEGRRI